MRWVPYQANTVFVVSQNTSPISSKFLIFSAFSQLVGTIEIGDDPEDFTITIMRYGYEPVINWVAENWRDFYNFVCRPSVNSILGVPALHLEYDEE